MSAARSSVVGIVAPGAMGAALGRCLAAGGHRVVVALAGRGSATVRRAREASLEDLGGLDALVGTADVVLGVVPPGQARALGDDLAAALVRTGARPLMAELDAVSPATVAAIAEALPVDLVDGGISGPPPRPDSASPTRVFLSGPRAAEVAALSAPGVAWSVLDGPVGAASATKMCTASVRKGYEALLAHALVAADAHGVVDAVVEDLRISFPDAGSRRAAVAVTKAWRYVDEMEQIAETQDDAGLTPALFRAFAQVYRDLATGPWGSSRPEDLPADVPAAQLRPGSAPGR